MTVLYYILMVFFVFTCLILMGLVLIQKGRGGGLAGAFGGGGGGHTAFGSKTGDVLTWTTSIVFGVFLLLAIGLNWTTTAIQTAHDKKPGIPAAVSSAGPGPAPISLPTQPEK